jgi:hypothetical protein
VLTPSSRYNTLEKAEHTTADGRVVVYVRRRFIPSSEGTIQLAEHRVASGDRPDNVTARYLGDPEQFWRVADANGAMRPDDLTAEIGRVLTIPLPSAG